MTTIVDPYEGSIDSATYTFRRRSNNELVAIEDASGALARLQGHSDPAELLSSLIDSPRTVTFEGLTITPAI